MTATTTALLLEAIDLISSVVTRYKDARSAERITSAADALTVIAAVIETVRSPDLQADPVALDRELDRLRKALSDNDSAADQALKDKFKG